MLIALFYVSFIFIISVNNTVVIYEEKPVKEETNLIDAYHNKHFSFMHLCKNKVENVKAMIDAIINTVPIKQNILKKEGIYKIKRIYYNVQLIY